LLNYYSLFRGSLVSKNAFIETEKSWQRMQSFPRQLVRFLFFTEVNGKPVYVWCVRSRFQWWKNITNDVTTRLIMPKDTVACMGNREDLKELIAGLKKQQFVFTSSRDISAAPVKASYLIANDIALASKPYSESEFVKTWTLKAAETACSEKLKLRLNLPEVAPELKRIWHPWFKGCVTTSKFSALLKCNGLLSHLLIQASHYRDNASPDNNVLGVHLSKVCKFH